ncbi:MAG TPA: DUF2207 domain-containing protein, partial [Fimbriimonadaceae bacterium]|nr:DUF2207 domain-containing protein [Fimbriimonadaceae bacterium]
YRLIPVVYPALHGQERAIHLNLNYVTTGRGEPVTTKVSRSGDDIRIRMGDADVLLPAGTQITYVISYSVFGAINWLDDDNWEPRAELYWNVTGTGWSVPIEKASFRVTFPKGAAEEQIHGRAFAGSYGSANYAEINGFGDVDANNSSQTSLSMEDGVFSGERDQPLSAYNNLTFVLSVPASVVPRPTPWQEFVARVTEYLPVFTPLFVFLIMGSLWSRFGRDEKDGPTTVRFEPPAGLGPAETGAMIDERVDQRDLAAGIMSLAVKGYLTVSLEQKEGLFKSREYTLHLTDKTGTPDLSPFEEELHASLASCGTDITTAEMRQYVAPNVTSLKNTIYGDLVKRGYYKSDPNSVRVGAIFGGILLAGLIGFLLSKFSLIQDPIIMALGIGLGLIPAVIFGYQMPKRTYAGTQCRREVNGFYEMMRHRENYMKWVVDTHPDGLKYEEYLPYAVAFDLIEQWNDAFKDIVTEPPSWYNDPYGGTFSTYMFASSLRSMTSDFGSAAATPPRSSGASGGGSGFSSGGGFSGGGFGGGGGGSW